MRLRFFTRTSSGRSWNLASYHSPHSMTWRWLLNFRLPRKDEGRWLYFQRSRLGQEKWCLYFLKFRLGFSSQEPMWYRDQYWRLREKCEP